LFNSICTLFDYLELVASSIVNSLVN